MTEGAMHLGGQRLDARAELLGQLRERGVLLEQLDDLRRLPRGEILALDARGGERRRRRLHGGSSARSRGAGVVGICGALFHGAAASATPPTATINSAGPDPI